LEHLRLTLQGVDVN